MSKRRPPWAPEQLLADYAWFSRPHQSRLSAEIEAFFRKVSAAAEAQRPNRFPNWRQQARAATKIALHSLRRTTAKRDKNLGRLQRLRIWQQAPRVYAAIAEMKNGPLSQAMDRHGSDKGSLSHNYTLLYEALLPEPLSCGRMLEVGIGSNSADIPYNMGPEGVPGASLRAWRDYFPVAEIIGADLDTRILFEEERIRTFQVDQNDPRSVERLFAMTGGGFDLIVDDGCHELHANRTLFERGFARLKQGGIYVIEDVVLSRRGDYKAFLRDHDAALVHVPVAGHDFDNCLAIVARE